MRQVKHILVFSNMKNWLKKIWNNIKVPVKWAAVVIVAGLFLFCVIDGIVRCFHSQIFNGIVQVLTCAAAFPLLYLACLSMFADPIDVDLD